MDIAEKYAGKTITDLGKLFFEIGNEQLVPELGKHILVGVGKFQEMQEDDEDLSEMIIMADLEKHQFVFAKGDGSEVEDDTSEDIFYIAKSEQFNDCMDLLNYICFDNHPEGYLNLSSEVSHWIGDAMPDLDDEMALTIYGMYDYAEAEDDPIWES